MTSKAVISVVLTCHREGLLVAATLKSLARAIEAARSCGYDVETIVSLDRADQLTKNTVLGFRIPDLTVIENDFGDPALCRNRCIAEASGDYVAILDADDLIGSNWLSSAVVSAESDPRRIVWHPEVNVIFGEESHVFWHIDMEAEQFDLMSVIGMNPWTSLCFARRVAFLQSPYPACDFPNGIGHEDWAWNRLVIEAGYIHKVVKGTGHAIRRKRVSVVRQASAANSIPASTDLFRRILIKRAAVSASRQPLRPFLSALSR